MATLGEDGVNGSTFLGINAATMRTSTIQANDPFGTPKTNNNSGINWDAIAAVGVFLGVIFYFYPTMVAVKSKKKNKDMIFLTNMLLGWTGVVWLICLTVALMDNNED